jgi:hypothetical protein
MDMARRPTAGKQTRSRIPSATLRMPGRRRSLRLACVPLMAVRGPSRHIESQEVGRQALTRSRRFELGRPGRRGYCSPSCLVAAPTVIVAS